MPNPYFSFKQFTIYHHRCAMKVGIDGVLLGSWATYKDASRILDIGCGSGLISLMLAQRYNAEITAIDIEPNAVAQTLENVENSPWKNRISVIETSIQNFVGTMNLKYDLIVCNPPYFVNALKTPNKNRTIARHTDTLTHEELIVNAKKLLEPNGNICIILPVSEGIKCKVFAESIGVFCNRTVLVYPRPRTDVKRLLLEFSCIKKEQIVEELIIEAEQRHTYSKDFTELAKDFYLKL